MHRFKATLIAGGKRPYTSWTFLVIPPDIARSWGAGTKPVRGTIGGHEFRGNAAKGEGMVRVPIPKALRDRAHLHCGDTVSVTVELDAKPPDVRVPAELRAEFKKAPQVAALYAALPPSHRRAWAQYIAEAKQPETRKRRAAKAPAGIRARAYPSEL